MNVPLISVLAQVIRPREGARFTVSKQSDGRLSMLNMRARLSLLRAKLRVGVRVASDSFIHVRRPQSIDADTLLTDVGSSVAAVLDELDPDGAEQRREERL